MTGIVGVISRGSKENALELVQRMSEKISHRGEQRTFNFSLNYDSIVIIKTRSHPLEPIIVKENAHRVVIVLGGEQIDSIMLTLSQEEAKITRRLFAMRPLYFSQTEQTILISSEKKALWEVGVKEASSLHPGKRLEMSGDGKATVVDDVMRVRPPIVKDIPRDEIIRRLEIALRASFTRIKGRRVGVLFSGGLDSSLVALLAKEMCKDVQLYSASSALFHDRVAAADAAQALGLTLNSIEIDSDTIWNTLPELMYAIERAYLMDVEISLPFFLASGQAAKDGASLILSGQGPDELFAGYARHVRIFKEEGEEALDGNLWQEVMNTHEANIERDDRAIAAHGIESYFPYLSTSFIDLALRIPSGWKICPGEQPERKVIFRDLARQMGLPESIYTMPKKATQYSSGSGRMLIKSLSENAEEMVGVPRKEQRAKAQEILNSLALEIGIPMATSKED